MGGFFSSPSAPSAPSAPPPLPAAPDPEIEARKLRLENIARNRRGRAGMVVTSERGVLEPIAPAATGAGKSLLGE
ncbi:MAG: hypothetical protein H7Y60_18710 [Rhodospirillaceae bacterium]|nr:hypothetical protein [Rhodospirillales bacterium]